MTATPKTHTACHEKTDKPPHLEWDASAECLVGKDPRKLSGKTLITWGVQQQPRTDAIRSKCLDCCGGSPAEVRRCGAIDCALWPYRMATDPWHTRAPMTDEQRAIATERLAAARNRSLKR